MKKLLLVVASLALGGLVWAASNSACIFNLIPPTSAVQVCQDGSGQMNFQDATAGPVTLLGLNAWQTYIANSGGGVTVSTNVTVSGTGNFTGAGGVNVTGASGETVTYGVTAGSVTTPLVTASTMNVTSSMTVTAPAIFTGTVTVTNTTNLGAAGYAVSISSNAVLPGTTFYQGGSIVTTDTLSVSSTTLTGFAQLFSRTLATLQVMTPSGLGQLFYCSNCASTPVCVSTGTSAAYQFAAVSVSTGATNGLGACK